MSRPVGGILSGPCPDEGQKAGVAIHLSGLPGKRPFSGTGRAARLPRLALLRVGFTEPAGSPPSLVRSYRTFSPLPVRTRHPGPAIGGLFSVALSCESPRLASPAPCSAESRPSSTRSRLSPVRAAATRPTHRRIQFAIRTGREDAGRSGVVDSGWSIRGGQSGLGRDRAQGACRLRGTFPAHEPTLSCAPSYSADSATVAVPTDGPSRAVVYSVNPAVARLPVIVSPVGHDQLMLKAWVPTV